MMKALLSWSFLAILAMAPLDALAQAVPADPLKSVMWSLVRDTVLVPAFAKG